MKYDYFVIGTGSAGSIFATRLTEAPERARCVKPMPMSVPNIAKRGGGAASFIRANGTGFANKSASLDYQI